MKRISFVCEDVDRGQILYRCTKGIYECWTIEDRYADMIHQFGCTCYSMEEFIDLVHDNLRNGNIIWQGDLENNQ